MNAYSKDLRLTVLSALAPLYARAPEGQKTAFGKARRNWGKNVTLVASLSSAQGHPHRLLLEDRFFARGAFFFS